MMSVIENLIDTVIEDTTTESESTYGFCSEDAWMFLPTQIVGGTDGVETMVGNNDSDESE